RRTVRWLEVTPYPTGKKVGEVSVTPIIDGDGRCTALVGAVHDVTDEHQLDETVRQYAEIVRAVQIALAIWDVNDPTDPGGITLAGFNPEAERIVGDLRSRLHRPLLEILPGAAGAQLLELVPAVAAGGKVRELPALTVPMPQGGARTYALKSFPLSGVRVGLAVDDVTAQARARAQIAAENRVLEMV